MQRSRAARADTAGISSAGRASPCLASPEALLFHLPRGMWAVYLSIASGEVFYSSAKVVLQNSSLIC